MDKPAAIAKAQEWMKKHQVELGLAVAFLIPLKLLFTYIVLIPLLLFSIFDRDIRQKFFFSPLEKPLVLFTFVAAISSFFGVNPLRSIHSLASLLFFSFTIPAIASVAVKTGPLRFITALLAGSTLASVNTVLNAAVPEYVPRIFLGKVTESGQLALNLTIALVILISIFQAKEAKKSFLRTADFMLACINLFIFGCLSFSTYLELGPWLTYPGILLAAFSICYSVRRLRQHGDELELLFFALLTIILPLLFSAFLVNLKRGPWAGVLVGVATFIFFKARKLFIPTLLAACVVFLSIAPVRERLAASREHFFIHGGRSVIWQIGAEFVLQYPLGIGFSNSPFLRKFSLEIPKQLKHFHNNYLNIAAETGWLGLLAFLFWIATIIKVAFTNQRPEIHHAITATSIGCAIIAWQVAGLVEYNFGDSEVLLLVFVVLGILQSVQRSGGCNENNQAER